MRNNFSLNGSKTVLVYAIAVLYVVLGLAFLCIPQLEAMHLCYLLAICLILLGVVRIAEYFIRESYQNSAQYGFSVGVVAIILGICAIVRVEQFVSVFHIFLGIGILLTAVIKLQHGLDLRALQAGGYLWVLIVAVVMILAASVVLFDPFSDEDLKNRVTYMIMIGDGLLTVVSTTYLLICVRRYHRNADRADAAAVKIVEAEVLEAGESGTDSGEYHAKL
ncbi:MAG: hypothetical protein HFI42_05465 [Lachnospiraceae bacterium]|nr:hypothetical protein [Lachnospiraceae bacterium]MCI9149937.1 hypothetical protein [Lachnospiraceae bacterium]